MLVRFCFCCWCVNSLLPVSGRRSFLVVQLTVVHRGADALRGHWEALQTQVRVQEGVSAVYFRQQGRVQRGSFRVHFVRGLGQTGGSGCWQLRQVGTRLLWLELVEQKVVVEGHRVGVQTVEAGQVEGVRSRLGAWKQVGRVLLHLLVQLLRACNVSL